MTSLEEVAAESLYQRAVLRVYEPWLESDVLSGHERRRARARVEHARLVLAMRGVDLPGSAPAVVAFNERWDRCERRDDRCAAVQGA